MKKNKCLIYLILTIIIIIFLGGVVIHYSKSLYICKGKSLEMRCKSLSSTNKSCYPDDNLHSGYKICKEGWELKSNNRWFK